jgi:hypothetical protein
MDIYDIKELTEETSPYFFSESTLSFFGQTLEDFEVEKTEDGKYYISAPRYCNGKLMGHTERIFNPETNELERI